MTAPRRPAKAPAGRAPAGRTPAKPARARTAAHDSREDQVRQFTVQSDDEGVRLDRWF